MNKKSFICGVIVGVLVTWALSFYLYYSLNSSQTSAISNLQKNIFNFDDSDEDDNDSDDKGSSAKKIKLEKEKKGWKIRPDLEPVKVPQFEEFGIIKNVADQAVRDMGYKTHAFNVLVSNQIGSFRDIPDTRHKM